jgi:hypothetical protein
MEELMTLLKEKRDLDNKLKIAERLERFNNDAYQLNIIYSSGYVPFSGLYTIKSKSNEVIHEFIVNEHGHIQENQYYCHYCGKIDYEKDRTRKLGVHYCGPCYKKHEHEHYD